MNTLVVLATLATPPLLPQEGPNRMALARHATHFALAPESLAQTEDVLFTVEGLPLAAGKIRSDAQGARVLTPGQVHTISSANTVWRLVSFQTKDAHEFWSPRAVSLLLIRTDLTTGTEVSQTLEVSGLPTLRWAGDLNRDGQIDLLIDDGTPMLWLSSEDALVQPYPHVTVTPLPVAMG